MCLGRFAPEGLASTDSDAHLIPSGARGLSVAAHGTYWFAGQRIPPMTLMDVRVGPESQLTPIGAVFRPAPKVVLRCQSGRRAVEPGIAALRLGGHATISRGVDSRFGQSLGESLQNSPRADRNDADRPDGLPHVLTI